MPRPTLVDPTRRMTLLAMLGTEAGSRVRRAVKVHAKNLDATTFEEFIDACRGGLSVTLRCGESEARRSVQHTLRMNPDGSITMSNHPESPFHDTGQDQVALAQTERLLVGMDAPTCACVLAAAFVPYEIHAPRHALRFAGTQAHDSMHVLWATIQWAQVPDHDWSTRWARTCLDEGVGPRRLAAWVGAGFDEVTALRFLAAGVALDLASKYLAAGRTRVADVKVAALGQSPAHDDVWAAAGFSTAQSAGWRRIGWDVARARRWADIGATPNLASYLTAKVANAWTRMTLDDVFEWANAGVPVAEILNWHTVTRGDLDQTLHVRTLGLGTRDVDAYHRYAASRPHLTLSIERFADYLRIGLHPTMIEQIDAMDAAGVTPEHYLSAFDRGRAGHDVMIVSAVARVLIDRAPIFAGN